MPATWVALAIVIIFLIPGFLADFLLGNWAPRPKREATEIVLTSLLFSLLSLAIISFALVPTWVDADRQGYREYAHANALWLTFLAIVGLIALPVVEVLVVGNLTKWPPFVNFVQRWLGLRIRPAPKAWDYLWGQDRNLYAIVTLSDGSRIGAGWSRQSWASGFPNDEDVYFEVVYSLTEGGRLDAVVPHTAGLLLKRADILSVELIDYESWGARNDQGEQGDDTGNQDPILGDADASEADSR